MFAIVDSASFAAQSSIKIQSALGVRDLNLNHQFDPTTVIQVKDKLADLPLCESYFMDRYYSCQILEYNIE